MDKISEILTRGVANIIPSKPELEKLLRSGKKLNIYSGFDATAPKLTLGHTVPFRKLKVLADLGHNVIFLIGDFTTLIGDNSDKETERPSLSYEEVQQNFKSYQKQASKIIDFSKIQVKFNSEWLKKLSFTDVIKLCKNFSVGDFISRELIKKRLNDGKRIGLHELLYPAIQAYDHDFLETDIQIGATEQTFNMQAGRTLQKINRNKESYILTLDLLTGTDGRKMSKSWGNAIWLDDTPEDIYAKTMAIGDDLIIQYYTLATNTPLHEIEEIKKSLKKGDHPMTVKKKLAFQIVSELYNKDAASIAAENFEKTVQQKELPNEIPSFKLPASGNISISEVLTNNNFASSKSEAKRLIDQNAVSLNNEKITNPDHPVNEGILKVGKHKFLKIINKNN